MNKFLFFWITILFSIVSTYALDYYPGRILVKPKSDISLTRLQEFHKISGSTLSQTIQISEDQAPWQVVEFSPIESVEAKIKTYLKSGLIQWAEPDYYIEPAVTPNDPAFEYHDRIWHFEQVEAPAAWDAITDSSDIIIAVVDSGINYKHEDLTSNIWVNEDEIPNNGIDDDKDGYIDNIHGINTLKKDSYSSGDPMDSSYGHGTHVTGIIGAIANNGVGSCGVCWKANIMACKVFSRTEGTVSDAVEGISFATKNGAKIINASWVINSFSATESMKEAISEMKKKGILLVCAAGNSRSDIDKNPVYPASYSLLFDNVISVAATDDIDENVYNYGQKSVNIAAPGDDIYSTYVKSSSTNYYKKMSGTSMATPFISSAAALYWAQNPSATYLDVKQAIYDSSDFLSQLQGKCTTGGRLNLRKLLNNSADFSSKLTVLELKGNEFSFEIEGKENATYEIQFSADLTNWEKLCDITLEGTTGYITDDQIEPDKSRYYRAVHR